MNLFSNVFSFRLLVMETKCPFTKMKTKLMKMNPIGKLMAFQNDPYGFFDQHKPENTTKPIYLNLGLRRFFFCYDPQQAQSFLPFGGGSRICIGAALAKLEATLVLQKLCERYEMRPAHSGPPQIEALITAHTNSPLPVFFKRREIAEERAMV